MDDSAKVTLNIVAANLRHAYAQLLQKDTGVKNIATRLIAPEIAKIEQLVK